MVLTFDISNAEYEEFSSFTQKRKSPIRRWITFVLVVLLLVFNLYQRRSYDASGNTVFIVSLFEILYYSASFSLIFFALYRIWALRKRLNSADRDSILGERTLVFTDENITTKDTYSDAIYRWEGIKKWEKTTHLFMLFIAQNMAIIVPKRVFENAEKEAEFELLLKRKLPNLTSEKYLDA